MEIEGDPFTCSSRQDNLETRLGEDSLRQNSVKLEVKRGGTTLVTRKKRPKGDEKVT